jgi:HEAT repeat protein
MLPGFARAADPATIPALDGALKTVAGFDYGKEVGPLELVEQLVIEAAKEPADRNAAEERLLSALDSASTSAGKAFLCRQLRVVATARAVPRLEPLLLEPELSHAARYVLGRLAYPEADDALLRALEKSNGKIQAGIVATLADRRTSGALPLLAGLVGSADPLVAESAAVGLGKFAEPAAVKALEDARGRAAGPLRERIDDALLACADRLLAAGRFDEAARTYEPYHAPAQPRHLRIAALRGLVAARGPAAAPLVEAAMRSDDQLVQASAVAQVRNLRGDAAVRTFAGLLPSLPANVRELLLAVLGDGGNPAAAAAIAVQAGSDQEGVRLAALRALGGVGDASAVEVLLRAALGAAGPVQDAARESLARLRGEAVNAALIRTAGAGTAQERIESLRALAARRAAGAIAATLKATRDDDAAVRQQAIRTVGALAGLADLPALVALALEPKDRGDRPAVEEAVAAVFARIPDRENQARPVLAALPGAPADAKPALLRLLGRAASPKALVGIRAALQEQDPGVKESAVRTLADWPDPGPAADLLALAGSLREQNLKVLALRGYVRMAGISKDPAGMYARALELAASPEDKKLVLAGLGGASSVEALALVERHLEDESLRAEAALAAVQIAGKLRTADPVRAKAVVKRVLALATEPRIRQAAQEVLNHFEQYEGYVLDWVGAGPYQEKGKDGHALWARVLPPERPEVTDVKWIPLTRGLGVWDINLGETFGNHDDAAGYVRTQVSSPVAQEVQLELGSDDGIKVWLNGKLVHANDAERGLAPRQDQLKVALEAGANVLLVKVTNQGGGWAFCCRFRKPDGSALEGLKTEAK